MNEKPSGYGNMLIGGQERPFHVGFNQGEIFAGLQHRRGEDGQPLSVSAYGAIFSVQRLRDNQLGAADVRDFVYSALASGYAVDGLQVDFNHMQVGFWIDDADPEEVMKPLRQMVAQLAKRIERATGRTKNVQAPKPKKATGPKKPRDLAGL